MPVSYNPNTKEFSKANGLPLTLEERAELESLAHHQKIRLQGGFTTSGYLNCSEMVDKMCLEAIDFSGRSVLGIGCAEGFQLLWAEAHGASKVVGASNEFGLTPSPRRARTRLHDILGSTVEWRDGLVDLTGTECEEHFDIVLIYEGVTQSPDPRRFLEAALKRCSDHLVLVTPFIISPDTVPWVATLRSFEPSGMSRSASGPNLAWLFDSIQQLDFTIEGSPKIWEHDCAAIRARRNVNKAKPRLRSIEELATDEGLEAKTAVVMFSCERYAQAWRPFFTLFNRYWSDCPYERYLGTNQGSYPDVMTLQTGEDGTAKSWTTSLRKVLAAIPNDYVIFFQEDFLLERPVDTLLVRKLLRHAMDYDVGCLRLFPEPVPTGQWRECEALGTIGVFDDFRLSLQASIWKRSLLLDLLVDGEDPWVTEFVGSRRSQFCREPFLSVRHAAMPYYATAIIGGEWQDYSLALLDREGISREGITRKL